MWVNILEIQIPKWQDLPDFLQTKMISKLAKLHFPRQVFWLMSQDKSLKKSYNINWWLQKKVRKKNTHEQKNRNQHYLTSIMGLQLSEEQLAAVEQEVKQQCSIAFLIGKFSIYLPQVWFYALPMPTCILLGLIYASNEHLQTSVSPVNTIQPYFFSDWMSLTSLWQGNIFLQSGILKTILFSQLYCIKCQQMSHVGHAYQQKEILTLCRRLISHIIISFRFSVTTISGFLVIFANWSSTDVRRDCNEKKNNKIDVHL